MHCQKPSKKISAPLSPAEQQQLYQYVQENPTPRKIGLLLGLELGLRIGEICGLQWGVFDLKLGTLNINRTVCRISCGNGHTKVVIQTPKPRTSRREFHSQSSCLLCQKAARKRRKCCMLPFRQRVQAHRTPLLPEKHQRKSL